MTTVTSESIELIKRVQALAQAGLTFTRDKYDSERYTELRELSVRMLSLLTEENPDIVKNLFANEQGYQTPKIDVRAVVFDDDKLLMVREEEDGCWSLPGGWADIGYSAGEVAAKEAFEEAGVTVEPVKLLAVLDKSKHNHPVSAYYTYKMFIACRLLHGKPEPGMETTAVGFFGWNELPPLSSKRITKEQIEMLFSFHNNAEKETIFD